MKAYKTTIYIIFVILFSQQLLFAERASYVGINTTLSLFRDEINQIHDLGVRIVRINLPWQVVEPAKNKFDWSKTDEIIEAAQSKNLKLLFTLRSISSWGTRKQSQVTGIYRSSSMPADLRDWEHFLYVLASRYKGKGVYYEIENEVNTPAFWQGTLEEYIVLLKVSYSAIKNADTDTKVLPAAMGCGITRSLADIETINKAQKDLDLWLKAIFTAGTFDIINVHDYYFPSEIIVSGMTFSKFLDHIHDLIRIYGVTNKPIWITEVGYIRYPEYARGYRYNSSPNKQSLWLTQAFRQAFDSGVSKVFWILLYDRNESFFGSMGILGKHGKVFPAFVELKNIINNKDYSVSQ